MFAIEIKIVYDIVVQINIYIEFTSLKGQLCYVLFIENV